MDPIVIKLPAGTVTYDQQKIAFKRRGFGTITAYLQQIVGADLKMPRFLAIGKLQIATMSSQHSGLMPKNPWEIPFAAKNNDDIQALYDHLMASMRR